MNFIIPPCHSAKSSIFWDEMRQTNAGTLCPTCRKRSSDPPRILQPLSDHGPSAAGVHGSYPRDWAVTGLGGFGGVAHGTLVKSKNSNRLDCAASRAVRCADGPMKRFSTNLMIAV